MVSKGAQYLSLYIGHLCQIISVSQKLLFTVTFMDTERYINSFLTIMGHP